MINKNSQLILELGNGKIVFKFSNGKKIILVNTIDIPLDVIVDGKIEDIHHLYYLINKHLRLGEIKANKLSIVVESSQILARVHKVPLIEYEEIEEMLQYEVGEIFPIDTKDYINKFEILNKTEDGYIIGIFLFPKRLVKSYEKLAEILKMELVEINNHSVEYFQNLKKNNIDSCAVLKLDFDNFAINIQDDKNILYYKSIYLLELLDYIREENIDKQSVLKILLNQYVAIEDEEKKTSIKLNLLTLLNENLGNVDNLIKKFKVKKVLISGDYYVDNINQYIDGHFKGYEVSKYIENFKVHREVKTKKKFAYRSILNYKVKLAGVLTLFLVIINILWFNGIKATNNNLDKDLRQVYNNRGEIESKIKELNSLTYGYKGNIDYNEYKLENENSVVSMEIIKFLENIKDEDILFTEYIYENGILEVRGVYGKEEKLNELKQKIEKKLKVDFTISQTSKKDDYLAFAINFKIDKGD